MPPAVARMLGSDKRSGIAPATVTVVHADGRVSVSRRGERATLATVAVTGTWAPRVGDRVVVATGGPGERYVIGVLGALRVVGAVMETRDGASAEVSDDSDGEVIRVRDRQGRLLFEHRSGDQKSVIHAPEGNLELRADHGGIDLVARDAVRVQGDSSVEISSKRSVRIAGPGTDERAASTVLLDAHGMNLATPALDARATRADFAVDEARLVARHVTTALETARHVVGVVETHATRIVERARNVYREATELSQSRAGRMRLVAENTFHIFGKRTLIKAEEDVKLKGEKIHLG